MLNRTPRQCVQCGVDIWWDWSSWKDEMGYQKCEGYVNGHKPDNKLRKEQIAKLKGKPL